MYYIRNAENTLQGETDVTNNKYNVLYYTPQLLYSLYSIYEYTEHTVLGQYFQAVGLKKKTLR